MRFRKGYFSVHKRGRDKSAPQDIRVNKYPTSLKLAAEYFDHYLWGDESLNETR